MPTDMSQYPDNWPEIRNRILLRAGGNRDDPRVGAKCEWCGIVNYSVGTRDENGVFHAVDYGYTVPPSYKLAKEEADYYNDHYSEKGYAVVVLTIAHIHDPNPMNCDPGNLAALCQGCHNQHDVPMRKVNAAKTRRQKIIDAGQGELL